MNEATPRSRRWLLAAGLFLVTLAAFLPALRNGFVELDDRVYVTQNHEVLRGLSLRTLAWAFRSGEGGSWHPLTWVSHLVDVSVFGLRPWGHHLTSVVVHAASVAVLFWLLQRTTGSPFRSAVVALAFGLHPLRVESVAWVAERKDVLCAFFFLAALLQYSRYRQLQERRAASYAGVCALFAAALMSKPMAVTFPLVLLLWDVWPLRQSPLRLLDKVPLLGMSIAAGLLTLHFQQKGGAIDALPLWERARLVPAAYVRALGLTLWPSGLTVQVLRGVPALGRALLDAAALLAMTAGAFALRRRLPMAWMGVAWFLVTLAPTSGLIPVGAQLTADRYTYLPHVGLFVALVFAFPVLTAPALQRLAVLASAALLAALTFLTERQLAVWRSSDTLFLHALQVNPDNDWVWVSLGLLRLKQDRPLEAKAALEHALTLRPHEAFALSSLAETWLALGHPERAWPLSSQAQAIAPKDASIRWTRARVFLRQGRTEAAISELSAMERERVPLLVQRDLVTALGTAGRLDEAVAAAQRGLSRAPDDPELLFNLGITLARGRRFAEALAMLRHLTQVAPGYPGAADALLRVEEDLGGAR